MWKHLWVSILNTVSLKGIKQLVFEQWTFGVFQVFMSVDFCIKLSQSCNGNENRVR